MFNGAFPLISSTQSLDFIISPSGIVHRICDEADTLIFPLNLQELMGALEIARYIIRASFPQERMQYLYQKGTVVYTSRGGGTTKSFPALEWLAAMCSHIPNRGEQMVCYYGYYSNVSRGKRKRKVWMTPPPASSNSRKTKRGSGKAGPG